MGAEVLVTGRSPAKLEAAVEIVRTRSGAGGRVRGVELDLCRLDFGMAALAEEHLIKAIVDAQRAAATGAAHRRAAFASALPGRHE